MTRRAVMVVPCFNEERRLDEGLAAALVADARVSARFVDDGSSDGTRAVLERFAAAYPGQIVAHALAMNSGKAEAVRQGMLAAIADGATVVGFADADFATPPSELIALLDVLETSGVEVVLGSRIARLGATIERSIVRHAVGRVFATVAAKAVGTPVYDTQCGAKWFRVTPALSAALASPFSSRWSFDVELLCRLFGRLESAAHTDPARALEVPLGAWRDVAGTKLRLGSAARSFAELVGIWLRTERYARRPQR
jgi:glycosyltransferase involved in cell wall biosynthesis